MTKNHYQDNYSAATTAAVSECFLLICLLRLLLSLNAFSQLSHLKGLSPAWILMCSLRLEFLRKRFSHSWQAGRYLIRTDFNTKHTEELAATQGCIVAVDGHIYSLHSDGQVCAYCSQKNAWYIVWQPNFLLFQASQNVVYFSHFLSQRSLYN